MRIASAYQPNSEEIAALVAEYPLALLISACGDEILSTPLPLLLEQTPDGRSGLVGHFGAANPHIHLLETQPRALAVFQGPQGYISPSWLSDRTQAPTWNYMIVELLVEVVFENDRSKWGNFLERLVLHMERGRPDAWNTGEMSARYERLLKGVRPFRAEVLRIRSKFKLGQSERHDIQQESIAGVEREGQLELARRMAGASRSRAHR